MHKFYPDLIIDSRAGSYGASDVVLHTIMDDAKRYTDTIVQILMNDESTADNVIRTLVHMYDAETVKERLSPTGLHTYTFFDQFDADDAIKGLREKHPGKRFLVYLATARYTQLGSGRHGQFVEISNPDLASFLEHDGLTIRTAVTRDMVRPEQ